MLYARLVDDALDVQPFTEGTPAPEGWLPVEEVAAPPDTDVLTHVRGFEYDPDAQTVRVVWGVREWTPEEREGRARADILTRLAALEAAVFGAAPGAGVIPEVPAHAVPAWAEGVPVPPNGKTRFGGNVWRNTSGATLVASPAAWPQGWAQLTGLPPAVVTWAPGQAVKVGDLRTFEGVIYRCGIAHTTQADWTPPVTPNLWTPQRGARRAS